MYDLAFRILLIVRASARHIFRQFHFENWPHQSDGNTETPTLMPCVRFALTINLMLLIYVCMCYTPLRMCTAFNANFVQDYLDTEILLKCITF
jgi:hypothetical protein